MTEAYYYGTLVSMSESTTQSVLVIGQNRWGHGSDLSEAKRIFRKQGGKLANGYTIVEFSDGLKFNGVDQMGRVHWKDEKWTEGATVRDPNITEVQPKKSYSTSRSASLGEMEC